MRQRLFACIYITFITTLFTACAEEQKPAVTYTDPPPTTLDSLQGIWYSQTDSLYKIKIDADKWVEFVGGLDVYEIKFDISDTCGMLNNVSSGRYMSRKDTTSDNYCSKLEYVTDTAFAITNTGKTARFRR
jgi:hypothetical protein